VWLLAEAFVHVRVISEVLRPDRRPSLWCSAWSLQDAGHCGRLQIAFELGLLEGVWNKSTVGVLCWLDCNDLQYMATELMRVFMLASSWMRETDRATSFPFTLSFSKAVPVD